MTPEVVALALLVFALIATRPLEEARWRDGRLSDRASAALVVGRLPFLALGFALITGRDLVTMVVMTGIALGAAAVLHPLVVGRLRRVRAGRGRGGSVNGPE